MEKPEDIVLKGFECMWNYPSKEILILYHPDGTHMFRIPIIERLIKFFKIKTTDQLVHSNPAIILSFLGYHGSEYHITKNILENLMESVVEEREISSKSFTIKKISLNKYQKFSIKNGDIIIGLKMPKMLTPDNFRTFKYTDNNNRILNCRHPQLRRILKKFFEVIDAPFNELILAQGLLELSINNDDYLFEDADELILRDNTLCEGTYFELLPKELKEIIIGCVTDTIIINLKDTNYNSPLVEVIEKITDNILEEQDVNIMDIYNKMNGNGDLEAVVNLVRGDGDIYKYITSQFGLNNIVNIIKKKTE